MYRTRRRRRIVNYVPRGLTTPWSHETTNIAFNLTAQQENSFLFPVDGDGVFGSIVIPSISAQGIRYIRNIRMKITVLGNPVPVNCLLIYCPASINPDHVGQQNQSSLYEPNQNLILHSLQPPSCHYLYDAQNHVNGKQPIDGTTTITYSKAQWKLNSDDCVKIVCSVIGGMFNSASAALVVVGTLDYWIRF